MKIRLAEHAKFQPDKMAKIALGATERALLDLYCVAPGQAQKPHTHGDQDKLYVVLEGRGRITIGGSEQLVGPLEAVIAPAGVEHGLVNDGPADLLVLVVVAPPPPHA
jgi:quercetin dioxygenase-like cupin family protein